MEPSLRAALKGGSDKTVPVYHAGTTSILARATRYSHLRQSVSTSNEQHAGAKIGSRHWLKKKKIWEIQGTTCVINMLQET